MLFGNRLTVTIGTFLLSAPAVAAGSVVFESNTVLLLSILVVAKWVGYLFKRVGIPELVGELLAGVLLGNLALFGIDYDFAGHISKSEFLQYAAELGVVILLFQVGLETSITDMVKVGVNSLNVAVVGVVLPVAAGVFAAHYLGMGDNIVAWFVGATLAATSVGITAKILGDARLLKSPSAQVILGAAVIDDVLGILVLAVLAGIVTTGSVSSLEVGLILFKCIAFFAGAFLFGKTLLPKFVWFNDINTSSGFWTAFALLVALGFAQVAAIVGLAPIIGAFTAGLILEDVHFQTSRQKMSLHGLQDLMKPITDFLLPIFFVSIGTQVRLEVLSAGPQLLAVLALTLLAIIGKVAAGYVIRGKGFDRLGIGLGMVPRGEVGLIFASYALSHNVMSPAAYSILVVVVLNTTIVAPILLKRRLRYFRTNDS